MKNIPVCEHIYIYIYIYIYVHSFSLHYSIPEHESVNIFIHSFDDWHLGCFSAQNTPKNINFTHVHKSIYEKNSLSMHSYFYEVNTKLLLWDKEYTFTLLLALYNSSHSLVLSGFKSFGLGRINIFPQLITRVSIFFFPFYEYLFFSRFSLFWSLIGVLYLFWILKLSV
jgi:hypothetical protein